MFGCVCCTHITGRNLTATATKVGGDSAYRQNGLRNVLYINAEKTRVRII